jgi:hypothetical protein
MERLKAEGKSMRRRISIPPQKPKRHEFLAGSKIDATHIEKAASICLACSIFDFSLAIRA